ncbi:hypothetical protein GCM10010232_29120 [Streptomyces amakusaensis]
MRSVWNEPLTISDHSHAPGDRPARCHRIARGLAPSVFDPRPPARARAHTGLPGAPLANNPSTPGTARRAPGARRAVRPAVAQAKRFFGAPPRAG